MPKTSSKLMTAIRLFCQCSIFFFSLAAIRDCLTRSNAGGVDAPGTLMVLCSVAIAAILFSYAVYYWRTGNYNEKELGAILFLLIPEILLWYAFQNPSKATTFFMSTFLCGAHYLFGVSSRHIQQKNICGY